MEPSWQAQHLFGVHVTEVQKVPLSKQLVLRANLADKPYEWRICVGARIFTVLA